MVWQGLQDGASALSRHGQTLNVQCLHGAAQELTKIINATNESNFAAIAQGKGGKLKTVSAVQQRMSTLHGA